ncbi:MAG: YmfQ family protein, partial [Oscillospiraceae bacterium]|nr:YmfQ family protein [Oscillospiraceae bacterium]
MDKPELNILHSPSAKEMLKMVTAGFYDKSYIALWLYEVIGREWDEVKGWASNLIFESIPEYATWSIAIWEDAYGIVPDDSLPLEIRRANLKARRIIRAPITPGFVEQVLNALTGLEVHVTENVGTYTFRVDIIDTANRHGSIDIAKVTAKLREIKQSHSSFELISESDRVYTPALYAGGALGI